MHTTLDAPLSSTALFHSRSGGFPLHLCTYTLLDTEVGETDVLIEARVLGYACDLVLPAHALVIEVLGGVHALIPERDAARLAAIEAQGLTVLTLTNEQVFQGEADQLFDRLLETRHVV